MIPEVFRQPWAITPGGFQLVLGVASRSKVFAEVVEQAREKALSARGGEPLKNSMTAYTRDGVAVIPVYGPLFRHANMMTELSGATSYGVLRKEFQAALDDPAVHSILFDIDSPGGEAKGCAEFAQAIFEARQSGKKSIVAYAGGSCASAAYWLASATACIVAAPMSSVGSIGVIATYLDDRKALEMEGLKEIDFVSAQSPHKKPDFVESADDRARFQERIDAMGQTFVETMARNRGVSVEHVLERFGKGDVVLGRDAIAVNLADQVGNFEALLADLVAAHSERQKKMQKTAAALGLDASATDEQCEVRATALVQHAQALMTVTGAADPDAALGIARANAEAAAELAALKTARAKELTAQQQAEFRSVLAQAIEDKRLTLAVLASGIPTLLDEAEEAKAIEALGKITEQTDAAMLAAVCSAQCSPRALVRVKSYVGAKEPVVPAPIVEPAHDPQRAQMTDVELQITKVADETRQVLDRQKRK
jgi:ClpP class serine protease